MQCPACQSSLTEKQIGSLSVRICETGCGGMWFDTLEMDQVDRDAQAVGDLLLGQGDSTVVTDPTGPRQCPRCETVQLKRVLLTPGSQVHIHECPSCDGCWLDVAELRKLHDERVDMINSGRVTVSGPFDLIQYLYEVRTGKRP